MKSLLMDYLKNRLGNKCNFDNEEIKKCLSNKIDGFCSTANKKWKESNYCIRKFKKKNEFWLQLHFNIPYVVNCDVTNQPSTSAGRPLKVFADLSDRSKRRHVKHLRETTTSDELVYAAKSTLYVEGKRAAAYVVSQVSEFSPKRAIKIRKMYKNPKSHLTPYTEDEALAFMVDTRMTKNSYHLTRLGAKKHGANIYPSYDRIRLAKERCYPKNIIINEIGASVPLQDLLNHTLLRLCETLDFDDNINYGELYTQFKFICKWGCDGSSGHSEYHQKFRNTLTDDCDERETNLTDSSVFLFSLVPLRLVANCKNTNENFILWENPCPSSTRYCRPIKFSYEKETTEVTRTEVRKTEKEIIELKSLDLNINNHIISISYTMLMTMVDGKVINTLTESSSQICFICKCNPKNMNNLDQMHNFQINENNFKYGLSTLHAWIKFLECVLHISYKLESAATTKRTTAEQKNGIAEKKKLVQSRLWNELGLKVDKVVQGRGTSNTGNVARRFFKNTEKVSEITGVDVNLLNRFSVILTAMSSGSEINYERFDKYAKETAELYVRLYEWYRMPPSIHKILMHGSLVIQYALVPIGQLSEEAQEARNKDYIRYREHHSRQNSRVNTNTDLFNYLLVTSDPKITALRTESKKPPTTLPPEVVFLLNIEKTGNRSDSESESSAFESEYLSDSN